MFALPLSFLLGTLAGIASLALLVGGAVLLAREGSWAGAAMVLFALAGRHLVLLAFPRGEPPHAMRGGSGKKIQAPDGSVLHVEFDGPPNAPAIVLTQGWGLDLHAWQAVRRLLSDRYRLVLWDLPGLGRSRKPADGVYGIVRLAEDLRRVIDEAGPRPVTVVGHGIGGMMVLSLCRLHPDLQGRRVNGIVIIGAGEGRLLGDASAAAGADLLRMLHWPLLQPLLLLSTGLWPLAWLLNLLAYTSGLMHLAVRMCAMGPATTRAQLELVVRSGLRCKPSILARGLRAMLRYDESRTPSRVPVPARLLWGECDRLIRAEALENLVRLIPDADSVEISGAGHHVPLEAPKAVADAIAQLAERAAKAAPDPRKPIQE